MSTEFRQPSSPLPPLSDERQRAVEAADERERRGERPPWERDPIPPGFEPPAQSERFFLEAVDHTLYDTAYLAKRTTGMFVTPLGQTELSSGRPYVKTRAETNMYLGGGALPVPQKFLVKSVGCLVFHNGLLLKTGNRSLYANQIWDSLRINFQKSCKTYLDCPALMIADPACVFSGVEASDLTEIEERLAKTQALRKLEPPVLIETMELFSVYTELNMNPDPDIKVVVWLRGTLYRAIQ